MNAIIIIFFLSYGLYSFFNNFRFWIIYTTFILIYYFIIKKSQRIEKSINISSIINRTIWSNTHEPDSYTTVNLDITKIIPYLKKKSEEIKVNITPTIFTIKLMSILLMKYPEINGFIKYGRYEPKDTIDICCIVQVGEGKELANHTINSCEKKSFKEISKNLTDNVKLLRERKNKDQNTKMNMYKFVPTFLTGPITQIVGYLSSIGFKVRTIGLKKYEFGSLLLTSIGSLGIENSYAPIPPFTFVPLLLTLCKKYDVINKLENGDLETRTYLKMNFTADYRFFNLKTAISLIKDIHIYGEDPEKFEDECKKYSAEI